MQVPEINYWAVILATLSTLVIGSVWYAPKVFGDRWMRLARVTLSGRASEAIVPIVVSTLVAFVTAWVLAGAIAIGWHFYGGGYFWNAIVTAVVLWAGLTAARVITHDAFERRPSSLTVLTIGHELVVFLVMAVIIGVWPPAGTV